MSRPKSRTARRIRAIILALIIAGIVAVAVRYVAGLHIAILDPKGIIALKERHLLEFALILGMIVIIPVFIMTVFIAWRYREGNTRPGVKYSPDWDSNRAAEITWWGIPILLILILSIVTWLSTYNLDPYKPLPSKHQAIDIQVVALDWKWLFIYPNAQIASVNYVQFPVNTPINLTLTADAPMNSFWIPQLSGQIYAMPGMSTQLHINATSPGNYNGSSANISGKGFAGMKFIAKASSQTDYDSWVQLVKQSSHHLTQAAYDQLAKPSQNNPPTYYATTAPGLYDSIVMKYMLPPETTTPKVNNDNHDMYDTTSNMKGMKMEMGQ